MSLGQRLKQLRKETGWSQDELAREAGIDGRQVSRYENDRVIPSVEVVIKMARAYNISLDYLLLNDVPRRPLDAKLGAFAQKVINMNSLPHDDEHCLLHLIEAIEAKNKLKEIADAID